MVSFYSKLLLSVIFVTSVGVAQDEKTQDKKAQEKAPKQAIVPVGALVKRSTVNAIFITKRGDLLKQLNAGELDLETRVYRIHVVPKDQTLSQKKNALGYVIYVHVPKDHRNKKEGGILAFYYALGGEAISIAKAVQRNAIPASLAKYFKPIDGPVPEYIEYRGGILELAVNPDVPFDVFYNALSSMGVDGNQALHLIIEAWSDKRKSVTWRFDETQFIELDLVEKLFKKQVTIQTELYKKKLSDKMGETLVSIKSKKVDLIGGLGLKGHIMKPRHDTPGELRYVELIKAKSD